MRRKLGRPPPALLALALVGAVATVSTAAILIRFSSAPPLSLAFHRLAIATLVLLPFAWWIGVPRPSRRDAALLAGVGGALALHFAAWIASLRLTTVASSVVLVTFHPILVAAVAHGWGDRLRAAGWAGIGLALVGAFALVLSDSATFGAAGPHLVGNALAFAGAVFAAAFLLAGRRLRQRMGLLAYAVPMYGCASLVLLLLALAAGEPLSGFAAEDYAIFAALALGPQIAGHTVLNWSLRHVPAPLVSTAIVGEPIGSTLLAFWLLHETPAALAIAGAALILAGVALVARGQTGALKAAGDVAP
ncbi:MAG TPA: DMT family transporter [Candidatus Thermoplasmatota archaeon]|nr:DMT family transporter [Candidatus Thermoplasmatota archaeon]